MFILNNLFNYTISASEDFLRLAEGAGDHQTCIDIMYNPKQVEEEVLKYWEKNDIPEKVRAQSAKQKKPFFFMDGPPYASGKIHLGTALNKSLKDIIIRVKRMQGFHVFDKPGYDTHGTPIEYKVEQEIGTKNKKDIEKFGVEKFIQRCREFATEHIETMNKDFYNLGVWMDWKNPYISLTNQYIEGIWFSFKEAHKKGLLYKGLYPVHVCSRCETAVAFNEIEHKDVTDHSVYFTTKVKKWGNQKTDNLLILAWTTTPWTIPANAGIMVNPDFDYVIADTGKEKLILAKKLVDTVFKNLKITNYKILKTLKGKEFEGLEYDHPLKPVIPAIQNLKNAHRVVLSSRYVTAEDGTGVVHIAPGHGKEDYQVGKESGLPIVCFVKMDGKYTEGGGKLLEGKYVKNCDSLIVEELSKSGNLLHKETITHSYPHCWRCKTPLLQIAVPQWFFKISEIQPKLLKANEEVQWVPEWGKTRFKDWLENLSDWPVSRSRYWGAPLPIWECEKCQEIVVVGSIDELKKLTSVPENLDLHKPWIDEITIKCKCSGKMKRVPEVLDVWFDAGVCSWASLNYPKEKDFFNKFWPPDINIEGKDQIRGWWNSQIITSFICFDKKPFKSIVMHGMILDLEKRKMSKSLGNIVQPDEVIEKYGRDHLRYYLARESKGEDFRFDFNALKEVHNFFNILWNTANFVKTYAPNEVKATQKNLAIEDRWILSKVNSFCDRSTALTEEYKAYEFIREITDFILNDFSRWYIKIIRDRVSPFYEGKDKGAAQFTLRFVLDKCLRFMAPIAPFLSESVYTNTFKRVDTDNVSVHSSPESVHLTTWPEKDDKFVDKNIEEKMEVVKRIIEAVHAIRHEKGIKLRWPVEDIRISLKEDLSEFENVLKLMCNTDKVLFTKLEEGKEFEGGLVNIGKPLKDEALVRELIRKTQELRKQEKLQVSDLIEVYYSAEKEVLAILKKFEKDIASGVGAKKIILGEVKNKKGGFEFEDRRVEIGFEKVV